MTDVHSAFVALARITQGWGGALIGDDISPEDENGLSDAPFSMFFCVNHYTKRVYYNPEVLSYPQEAAGVIHELGHVFACHDLPKDSEEFDFFGWEWALAREVDMLDEWLKSIDSYTLPASAGDFTEDFGTLSPEEQSDVIEERVQHAQRLGLVNDDKPVCIRHKKSDRTNLHVK